MLNEEQIKHFKEKLLAEKKRLEEELSSVGRINPKNPKDWEATPEELETSSADTNEVADTFEEYENRTAIVRELEIQLIDVNEALERIEKGTYGTCTKGGEEIPVARLEANPSAATCIEHAPEEE